MRRRRDIQIDESELQARLDELADRVPPLTRDELSAMAHAATAGADAAVRPLRRRPLRLAVAVGLAVAAAASLPAVGLRSELYDVFTKEASAQPPVGVWRWDELITGAAPVADREVRLAMQRRGAVPGRVARVARTTGGGHSFALLAAAGRDGGACFALKTRGPLPALECVALLDGRAIVHFSASARRGQPYWAVLLGVVRSDVERVVVLRADGTEQTLPLNARRAFTYSADSRRTSFTRVSGYAGDGRLVARVAFEGPLWSPLCAGAAGACPPPL